eukprot:TRINITY_DN92533_c0_g1_i1.p1 TRINITY_DN92533_c0_g1~~TRINITY_DN92533_c0_g1_i1.p1  ORF type:complete len:373 (-),score=71.94 TRINITY_DN92533_c0_g1_i1:282-1400(-)
MLPSLRSIAKTTARPLASQRCLIAGVLGQQQRGYKVSVLGSAGGIGQPLSLLLKLNPRVSHLSCYDVHPITPGKAVDLSHISTNSKCEGFTGDRLTEALDGADVVVIPAGVPRKPGMTRDDLFNTNAGIVKTLVSGVATACPDACILIISNPVNSTVPIAREVLKHHGVYNPKKLFGVTSLDGCRARTFVSKLKGICVNKTQIPVIGGHSGKTIVPLLSQCEPTVSFTDEERAALIHRVMFGGDEVVKAKDGGGSATLSMAHAGADFADQVMAGLSGEAVTTCAFVEQDKVAAAKFFALPVTLGKDGVDTIHHYGEVSAEEQTLLDDMLPELLAQAEKGRQWAADQYVKLDDGMHASGLFGRHEGVSQTASV